MTPWAMLTAGRMPLSWKLFVAGEEVVEAVEGVGDVVGAGGGGALALQRGGRGDERYSVVLLVEGDEAQGVVLEDGVAVQDRAVPVAHLGGLARLEHHVGELGGGHVDPP
ncbi:hypothetical protein GCM10020295_80090 [Streptomyces cinereospinus]